MTTRLRVIVAALLVALALGAQLARRGLVSGLFQDGEPGPAPPRLSRAPDDVAGLPMAEHVRVVLLDGLSAAQADQLPGLSRLCARGLDVRVDVGFPTVSLPVQHVLWTGLTQLQSGIAYRVARLDPPPPNGLPARVPGSHAVAESHRDIVHSFGFTLTEPALEDEAIEAPDSTWRAEGFAAAATAAVRSEARLVFVHVLAIDEAGHAHGADHPAYAEASARADTQLEALVAARPQAAWWVLADHGHRAGGGHGGAEPEIRIVRGCLVAPGVAPGAAAIHLVDVHRSLADLLGLPVDPRASGRPLAWALAHPDPEATLPRPGWAALGVAAASILAALAFVAWAAGRRVWAWPWWIAIAYASVVLVHGRVSLSNPIVYPPLGRDMLLASLPGAVWLWFSLRRDRAPWPRRLAVQLAPAIAFTFACLTAGGAIGKLLGLRAAAPLRPGWTAHASLGFSWCLLAALVAALAILVPSRQRDLDDRRHA